MPQYIYFYHINTYEYYRCSIWQVLSIYEPILASDDQINLDAFWYEMDEYHGWNIIEKGGI